MKILAADSFYPEGLEQLRQEGFEVIEHRISREHLADFINSEGIEGILVRSSTQLDQELLSLCPNLKLIGRGGIGTDNIDLTYCQRAGIQVVTTPGASSRSVAELVFAHFFSMARHLHESNRLMPLEGESRFLELKKEFARAFELEGKTLGIIGLGNIGKEVARMGTALGMRIKVLTRTERTETLELRFHALPPVAFQLQTQTDMESFLSDLDFLSIHTSKTEGYLLDQREFEWMKEGIYIVNTARGGVLNEVELLEQIEAGHIQGAALDVFETEPQPEVQILMNPALSLSPHLGGNTVEAQEKISRELARQIIEIKDQLLR